MKNNNWSELKVPFSVIEISPISTDMLMDPFTKMVLYQLIVYDKLMYIIH